MATARLPLAFCVALALLTLVVAAPNKTTSKLFWDTPNELPSWRLPTQTRPMHYDIDLDFTPRWLDRPDIWGRYQGSMNISVEFMGPDNSKAGRSINRLTHHVFSGAFRDKSTCSREGKKNQIIMHADSSEMHIEFVKVYKFDDKLEELKELKIAKTSHDSKKQLIAMDMAKELPVAGTKGVIELHFRSYSRLDDMHGIYMGTMRSRGNSYSMVTTQFQPSFARLAMPCFDEPEFKATFSLKLTYPPRYKAFANMPELSRTIKEDTTVVSTFKKSPPMSIHMLAFTIGEYEEPLELQLRDNLKLRAITPPGKREAGHYALEVAKFALERFEKYIGYEFPLEKLDIVALPDIDKDNAETWGLVFIRDTLALIDDETKPDSKITTAVNVAHVVVHQWFANLITAEWWDDLWITEGVAAQMAFELVADLFPEQSDYFVRISTLSSVLSSDSSGKNHSLSPPEYELMTADQSYDLFDNIEFMKSGALTRLLQNLLGYEEFRTVLQQLVRVNANGSVNFGDLLGAISTLPKSKDLPIEQILTSWTKLKSYPIINVDFDKANKKIVIFEEARPIAKSFVAPASWGVSPWVLPLSVLISDASGENQATEEVTINSNVGSFGLPSWFELGRDYIKVSPNPDLSTYYRVRYSDQALRYLKEPVQQLKLGSMDRLHLLDDSRSLAASKLLDPFTFEKVLGWFSNDPEPSLLIEMLLATQTLKSLDSRASSPAAFMRLFTEYGFRVSGNETLLEQRARMVVLKALVTEGVQEVIEAGVRAFEESDGNVALFLREPVYAAVAAAGTAEQTQKMFDHLKETSSHEEQMRLIDALAHSHNSTVLVGIALNWLKGPEDEQIWRTITDKRQKWIADKSIVRSV